MPRVSRRELLGSSARLGLALAGAPWLLAWTAKRVEAGDFAQALVQTPRQTEGPFYPRQLPLDVDNDLLVINNAITPAVGAITHLGGRVLDSNGRAVRNALVEIWQVDDHGIYLHPGSANPDRRDLNFQGFGRFLTSSTGEYYFRTIKPVPYPGRTPHVHFKIRKGDRELLTTQMYIKGHQGNARDGVLQGIRDPVARESVIVDFAPLEGSTLGELAAKFDIVLGPKPAML